MGQLCIPQQNSHLLIVFYLHEADKDPRDFEIKIVRMWDFPPEDLEIIRQDWEKIVGKIPRRTRTRTV